MSDEIAHIEREADEDDIDAARTGRDADLDLEAPEADSAEQRTELLEERDEPITTRPSDLDIEADPTDAAEQRRVVKLDEDDYR